ncbi:MAG: type II toxin-antitoxin system RelE/ParE family toxin [Methylococcaceae bacterium]
MTYKLRFQELALAEWEKLDATIRERFKSKLQERLQNPRVPTAALSGMPNCYKIKLRSLGYRLIYKVEDDIIFVSVIAIGKREKDKVYKLAKSRLQ